MLAGRWSEEILPNEVERALLHPGESHWVSPSRAVYQARSSGDGQTEYLLRVFVDHDPNPPAVVTAYRTSKIDKYWEGEQ